MREEAVMGASGGCWKGRSTSGSESV